MYAYCLFLCLISLIQFYNASSYVNVTHYWVFQTNSTIGYTHMPTITSIPSGSSSTPPLIISSWQEAKTTEGDSDQHIAFSSSTDYGAHWSEPISIASTSKYAVWGPVLYWSSSLNKLFLFFSESGSFNIRSTNRNYPGGNIMYQTSTNKGLTWSQPIQILGYSSNSIENGNISKVTANPMISIENVLNNTRWILPYWQEAHSSSDTGKDAASILISNDEGATWNNYSHLTNSETWLIENTIAQIFDGSEKNMNTNQTVLQFFRTKKGYIYESYSYDGGETWSIAMPTTLENPNSKTCLMTDSYKQQIVAYNPSKSERYPLDLSNSDDNSKSWNVYRIIGNEKISQAYPTVTEVIMNNGSRMAYTVYSDDTSDGIKLAITKLPGST